MQTKSDSTPIMPSSRILPWQRHLMPQVVERLLALATDFPWDLSNIMVVLPTKSAGRRLLDGLALRAAKDGRGVLPPQIVTPQRLLHLGLPATGIASGDEMFVHWVEILLSVPVEELHPLFVFDPESPVPPVLKSRHARWAVGLACQLGNLQATLAENGLDFSAVASRIAGEPMKEPERWAALAGLEAKWEASLRLKGLMSLYAAQRRFAAQPVSLPPVSRVVVVAVADLNILAIDVLKQFEAAGKGVEIWSFGDENETFFDAWGRPDPGHFCARPLRLVSPRSQFHLFADAEHAAEKIQGLVKAYRSSRGTLALGFGDPTAIPVLTSALAEAGENGFDPAGFPFSRTPVGSLVGLLLEFAATSRYKTAVELLRHPLLADSLKLRGLTRCSQATLLAGLDELAGQHLPGRIDDAVPHVGVAGRENLKSTVDFLVSLRAALNAAPFSSGLAQALDAIFSEVKFNMAVPAEAALHEQASSLADVIRGMGRLETRFPDLPAEVWPCLLARKLDEEQVFPDRPADSWVLQGWLELLFEDSPHLVVLGVNEGAVPESIIGDAFLPESLRVFLNLRTNRDRQARDAYLLNAILQARRDRGQVDLVVFKRAMDGSPRLPSRLLFQCQNDELLGRANALFAEMKCSHSQPARTVAWRLTVPREAPQRKPMSASRVREYLKCPFRYYLKEVLGMEPQVADKVEMDAMNFGTLCHEPLTALKDLALAEATDRSVIFHHLETRTWEFVRQEYGRNLSFAVRLQIEAALARFKTVARIEAQEREAGWRVIEAEFPWKLEIGGVTFAGRIDRIDRHKESGAIRVVDYKTGDKAKSPEAAHLGNFRGSDKDAFVLPASVLPDGKKRWTDVQLPLYLEVARLKYPDAPKVHCAYFNLPKVQEDAAIAVWNDFTPDLLSSALATAQAVAKAIEAGRFWPPAPIREDWDEFARLFPGSIDCDVDQSAIVAENN
ncbi:MAG: PD-(D/E)XK nuclease family protein [Opitutaceae bacterium]|nr:PD-(D/E)XK nuclease family protein [Opitutaceae bacterium]